jgi:hypothetical protein
MRRERAREDRERERETKPAVSRGFLSPPGTISGHFSHVLMTGNQPTIYNFISLGPKVTLVTSTLPGLESFG